MSRRRSHHLTKQYLQLIHYQRHQYRDACGIHILYINHLQQTRNVYCEIIVSFWHLITVFKYLLFIYSPRWTKKWKYSIFHSSTYSQYLDVWSNLPYNIICHRRIYTEQTGNISLVSVCCSRNKFYVREFALLYFIRHKVYNGRKRTRYMS